VLYPFHSPRFRRNVSRAKSIGRLKADINLIWRQSKSKMAWVSELLIAGFITSFSRFRAEQLQRVTIAQIGYETSSKVKIMTCDDDNARKLFERSLIDIAIESWRFSRLFARLVNKLDVGESGRYANQLRYFQKKVEENLAANGLTLVNVEGQMFDPGMAASALNIGDFGPEEVLMVDQMVEPIIMGPEGLKKQGTVMLRKAQP
jgi:hypothetical protein